MRLTEKDIGKEVQQVGWMNWFILRAVHGSYLWLEDPVGNMGTYPSTDFYVVKKPDPCNCQGQQETRKLPSEEIADIWENQRYPRIKSFSVGMSCIIEWLDQQRMKGKI